MSYFAGLGYVTRRTEADILFLPFVNHPVMNMRTRLLSIFSFFLLFIGSDVMAQQGLRASAPATGIGRAANAETISAIGRHLEQVLNTKDNRLPESIAIPGAVFIGVSTKYHVQTNHGGLHNIQVDPLNPQRIHAVVMAAPNIGVADTVGGAYPTRNIFYVFSNDGGVTWSAPKAISSVRAGFPDMILYKRGANYVPIIGAHRYAAASATDFICALYVEMGDPGAGNFKETLTDRKATVTTGLRDILWPSIAVSPDNQTVYMAASLNETNAEQHDGKFTFYPSEIGSFTLDATGSATWNGWKTGPNGPGGTEGRTSGGEYVLRVSPTGKLGLAWDNYDFNTPDLGLYFAESKDAGATWVSNYQPIWSTLSTSNTAGFFLRPGFGLDMFYDGEKVKLITGLWEDQEKTSGDLYMPNSGGIGYWDGDTNTATMHVNVLLSKTWPGTVDTGRSPIWQAPSTGTFEPQGVVSIQFPTIARSSTPGKWGVFFQAWQNDLEQVNDTLIYPYSGIYEMHTGDNGTSWTPSAGVLTNDASTVVHYDYRFPEVSSYNPPTGSNFGYNILFAADTAAGLWENAGYPGWDEVGWYYRSLGNLKVDQILPTTFTMAQNYPNPFNPSTTIKFTLAKTSNVELTVSDVLGRVVATLLNGQISAGSHYVKFDASMLTSGVYSYTMKANGQSFTQRMVLSK